MSVVIYHNPCCSKSRATLALLRERGHEPCIIEYLKQPPDKAALQNLQRQLRRPLSDMIRTGESIYRELNLAEADSARLLSAITENPILLQRPIVVVGERAIIGRPPERVLEIL